VNAKLCCNEFRVGSSISLLSFSLEDAAALSCLYPESLSVVRQRLDSASATYAKKPVNRKDLPCWFSAPHIMPRAGTTGNRLKQSSFC